MSSEKNYYGGFGIDELIKLAEQGDTIAQMYLGLAYEDGEIVEKNPEKASYWILKSAGDLLDIEAGSQIPEECRSCDNSHNWVSEGDCVLKDICGKDYLEKREPNETFNSIVDDEDDTD